MSVTLYSTSKIIPFLGALEFLTSTVTTSSCCSLQNSEYERAKIIMSSSQIITHSTVDVTDTRDTA